MYQEYSKWIILASSEILNKFGSSGLNLVNKVENKALDIIFSASKSQLSKRDIVVSGMAEKIPI